MTITIGSLTVACVALAIWVVLLVRHDNRESIARKSAESERDRAQRKHNLELTNTKAMLLQAQEQEITLKCTLDNMDRELTATRNVIVSLQRQLQLAERVRDESQLAEANLVERMNAALFELAQKSALATILKEELKNEAGERAEHQVLREYFEDETVYLRSILEKLNMELARARTKEARASVIEAFLSHLAGGLAEA